VRMMQSAAVVGGSSGVLRNWNTVQPPLFPGLLWPKLCRLTGLHLWIKHAVY